MSHSCLRVCEQKEKLNKPILALLSSFQRALIAACHYDIPAAQQHAQQAQTQSVSASDGKTAAKTQTQFPLLPLLQLYSEKLLSASVATLECVRDSFRKYRQLDEEDEKDGDKQTDEKDKDKEKPQVTSNTLILQSELLAHSIVGLLARPLVIGLGNTLGPGLTRIDLATKLLPALSSFARTITAVELSSKQLDVDESPENNPPLHLRGDKNKNKKGKKKSDKDKSKDTDTEAMDPELAALLKELEDATTATTEAEQKRQAEEKKKQEESMAELNKLLAELEGKDPAKDAEKEKEKEKAAETDGDKDKDKEKTREDFKPDDKKDDAKADDKDKEREKEKTEASADKPAETADAQQDKDKDKAHEVNAHRSHDHGSHDSTHQQRAVVA